MGFVAQESLEGCPVSNHGEECMLDADIKVKEGCDVTGSWDKASLYVLWTRVSSGTGLFHDMVVASAVSVCVFQDSVFHEYLLMDSGVGTL